MESSRECFLCLLHRAVALWLERFVITSDLRLPFQVVQTCVRLLFGKLALSPQETENSDAHTLFKMAGEDELLTISKNCSLKNILVLVFLWCSCSAPINKLSLNAYVIDFTRMQVCLEKYKPSMEGNLNFL